MEIGRTLSVCPVCLSRIPAKKLLEAGGIYMEKKCPDHGWFQDPHMGGRPGVLPGLGPG